jgi:hypothetical protein
MLTREDIKIINSEYSIKIFYLQPAMAAWLCLASVLAVLVAVATAHKNFTITEEVWFDVEIKDNDGIGRNLLFLCLLWFHVKVQLCSLKYLYIYIPDRSTRSGNV